MKNINNQMPLVRQLVRNQTKEIGNYHFTCYQYVSQPIGVV